MRLFHWRKKASRQPQKQVSLQSSLHAVEVLGHRRYLKGEYLLPKDQQEGDRLTFQHYYFKSVFQGNYVAPLDPARIRDILDVGTGSGIWAREMAQEFPAAYVLGLDQESFPLNLPPPPNYRFVRANLLEGLPFEDQSFDYVHQRLLVAGIPASKWQTVIMDLARVMRSGGWVELLEFGDFFDHYGPATKQLRKWWRQIATARHFDMDLIPNLHQFLTGAHLYTKRNVVQVPIGGHDGDLLAKDLIAALQAMSSIYCTTCNISPEQFKKVLYGLPQEWREYQTRFLIFTFLGEKL